MCSLMAYDMTRVSTVRQRDNDTEKNEKIKREKKMIMRVYKSQREMVGTVGD